MSLAELVIKESKNDAGTWTYKFLSSIHMKSKELKRNEYNKFISQLFSYLMEDDTPDLQRFKVAQMLSYLKLQNPSLSIEIFEQHKEAVEKFSVSIDSSKYGNIIKKHLRQMYASPEASAYSIQKIKHLSASPRIVPAVVISGHRRLTFDE